jgi:Ca-activated chloride channel homolog
VTALTAVLALAQINVNVQLVTVNFSVDDPSGRPVLNLTQRDFTILEDGEQRQIYSFEPVETPFNILLLFDRSTSTQDQWPFLVRAISRFIQQMPEQHRIALAAFDDKPELLLRWRSAQEFLRQSLSRPEAGGGTNVYRALEWAAQELKPLKGRQGVLVFTDGVDNRLSKDLVSFGRNGTPTITPPESDSDFQKMVRTVRQGSSAVIYFVAVNTDLNPDPNAAPNVFDLAQRKAARMRMAIVANVTNGVLHLPQKIEDVTVLYEAIGRELGQGYTVSFTPKSVSRDGSFHTVQVRANDKNLHVKASRESYYAY